jgi:hypothetical protein
VATVEPSVGAFELSAIFWTIWAKIDHGTVDALAVRFLFHGKLVLNFLTFFSDFN